MVVMTRHELAVLRARFRHRLARLRSQRRIATKTAVIGWVLLLAVLVHARLRPVPQCNVSQALAMEVRQ